MNDAAITIALTDDKRVYAPHEILTGVLGAPTLEPKSVHAVEVSVLWYTEGKGDEDMAVHHFDRLEARTDEPVDLRRPRPFSTRLPGSPLSYAGAIVNVLWCVRVRLFLVDGKEIVAEELFKLGSIPSVQPIAS